ncbi:MAG: hypothetical protein HOE53_02015 [Candidatus Magasanikbacteria bacterium]|jgi:hypothetical protein|nr:hypothetical protein [Candidatus Magasanikbacteria bacterium]
MHNIVKILFCFALVSVLGFGCSKQAEEPPAVIIPIDEGLEQVQKVEQPTYETLGPGFTEEEVESMIAPANINDADSDGLTDEEEKTRGTDPLNMDTDNDGLSDKAEIMTWKTDPLQADTDGDGFPDAYEISEGFNPLGEGELTL